MSEPGQSSADSKEHHEESSCASDNVSDKSTAAISDDVEEESSKNDEEPPLAEKMDVERQTFDDKQKLDEYKQKLDDDKQKLDEYKRMLDEYKKRLDEDMQKLNEEKQKFVDEKHSEGKHFDDVIDLEKQKSELDTPKLDIDKQKFDDKLFKEVNSSGSPIVIPAREPPKFTPGHDDQVNNNLAHYSLSLGNESQTGTNESQKGTENGAPQPVVEFVNSPPHRILNVGDENCSNFPREETSTSAGVRSRPPPPEAVEVHQTVSSVIAEEVENHEEPEEPEELEEPVAFATTESFVVVNENGQQQSFVAVPENGEQVQNASKGLSRKTLFCFFVVLILAIVVTVLAVFFSVSNKSFNSVSAEETKNWKTLERVVAPLSGEDVLSDVMSPQYRALSWMAEQLKDGVNALNEERIIQRYALAVLYFATGGVGWLQNLRFLSSENECKWKGASSGNLNGVVRCDDNGQVVDLKLDGNSLIGTIPNEVGLLSSLTRLQLNVNFIEGTILPSLGQLKNLKVLKLANNSFWGSIPDELGQLTMLSELHLENNHLSGLLPSAMGKLSKMRTLDLSNNQKIEGTIPSALADLQLENVRIGGTNITGNASSLCLAVKEEIQVDCTKVGCFCKEKCACVSKDNSHDEMPSYVSFKSSLDDNYCLNLKDGRVDIFTKLELSECDGSPSQKFSMQHNQIRPLLSQDVCVEMDPEFTVFVHSACIDKWAITLDGSLLNVQDEMCVSIQNSTARHAAPIIRGDCNGTASQIWFLDDQPPYVELRSGLDRSLCLEVEAGNVKDKTRLVLWPCDDSPEQQFHLDGDGRLRTKVRPDACVEAHPEFGLFIHSECIDTWELCRDDGAVRKVGDEVWEKCITVKDFSAQAGDPVVMEECSGALNQLWTY